MTIVPLVGPEKTATVTNNNDAGDKKAHVSQARLRGPVPAFLCGVLSPLTVGVDAASLSHMAAKCCHDGKEKPSESIKLKIHRGESITDR